MLQKIILILLISSISFADDTCTKNSIVTEIEGCRYLCLSPVFAKEMFILYETYPDFQLRLRKSLELLEVRADTIQLMANIHINLGEQKIVLQEEVVGLRNQINNMDAWYKSPYLWICIGIVLGIGTTVGITYGVNGG